jgi:hypothetical protein
MPVYRYECTPCLVVYEVLHGMNDPPQLPEMWGLGNASDLRTEDQSAQLFRSHRG